jgi:hypothetical protein
MRADLSNAIGAVEWGESQLPILSNRLLAWEATNVELVAADLNPPFGNISAIASAKEDLPPVFHAELGAIIGSFRSALDLLGAALAVRNGISPSRDTHFPVFRSLQDMIDPLDGIQRKKWLSAAEVSIIKSLCPYEGGNEAIWSLHQLDILRKHERLITCMVYPRLDYVVGQRIGFPDGMLNIPTHNLKDKPVLFVYSRDAPKPEAQLSIQIVFDEIGIGAVHRKPVFPVLVELQDFVRETILRFDAP